jgi:hypothetical protein
MNKVHCLLISSSLLALGACKHHLTADSSLSQADTIAVLQTALHDSSLVADAALYLPRQPLKIIQNQITKLNYSLTFGRQAVQLIPIKEGLEVRRVYPQQLIVSFPLFKVVHQDTVILTRIIHSDNTTNLYKLGRNRDGSWHILSNQRGKL